MAIEAANSQFGNSAPDHLTNPSNPYFLHPNENPALVLVSHVLSGSNYHSWARAMRMALQSKNKMKFVDGTLKMPATTYPIFSVWERCNTMVVSWITHAISQSIAQKCPVDYYFTHLKILWDELENFRSIPQCTYATPCICEALVTVRNYRENDYVIRFLKGLKDQLGNVRSQIMLLEPLPSINKVFSLVVQQEGHMNIGILTEPKVLVNKSSAAGFQRNIIDSDTPQGDHEHSSCSFTSDQYQRLLALIKQSPPTPDSHLVNQDLSTLKKIGTARAKDGLYALVDPATPSFPLSPLPAHLVSISAKKLPFAISTTQTNKIFELVHVDIWGPFSVTAVHGHRYFLTVVDDFSRHSIFNKSKGHSK
ncbi:uncharacterized protein LOC131174038 [Hevea brasiliensis]|uniref:uncharacterized protein LOC131174038 n=1 Tax=Hevea brasiliensis TaxID=3981 RepID=UPI0025CEAB38|nr:uncharacterized protein LOC131174038 [Hevea brasiliensis]